MLALILRSRYQLPNAWGGGSRVHTISYRTSRIIASTAISSYLVARTSSRYLAPWRPEMT